MATIKSYSDLEQSQKLAEILPLESADMCYAWGFSELKESEDEKIRKELKRAIAVALDYSYFDKETADNCIAWLEKQGNHNKIDYDEELKKCKANPLYFFDKYVKVKLKEQKPTWSKEDERHFSWLIEHLGQSAGLYDNLIDWLKSLKDRYTWKPSNEQINALEYYIYSNSPTATITKGTIFGNIMVELLEQLKKLREE